MKQPGDLILDSPDVVFGLSYNYSNQDLNQGEKNLAFFLRKGQNSFSPLS
jgi:hypothetical protein